MIFIFDLSSSLGPMDPGPVSSDILHLQEEHLSAHVDLSRVSFYVHYLICIIENFVLI